MKDLIHYEDGVHAIDSGYGRPQLAAIHVIVQDGRAAVVDTASNASVPRILGALAALGIAPEAVDWVLLTHIHLDHAGGAGSLMCALPQARLLVHPRGLRHMIDPSKLWEATCSVYGPERAFDLYGQLVPVPAERIVPATDGLEIQVGSRMLRVFDTPGHARHHICIWDSVARAFFTGDTFGLSYRELDVDGRAMVIPTTTPTQFDPEQLVASIRRIAALKPDALYLTHYSRVTDIPRLAAELERQLGVIVAATRAAATASGDDRADCKRRIVAAMRDLWLSTARNHGVQISDAGILSMLELDLELNADGLIAWLDRAKR